MGYLYAGPCEMYPVETPEKFKEIEAAGHSVSFVENGYMPFSNVRSDAIGQYIERKVFSGSHQCDVQVGRRKEYLFPASELNNA